MINFKLTICRVNMAWHGGVRLGRAWQGRHGTAWPGEAWQGKAGKARQGSAGLGVAGLGLVWQGTIRGGGSSEPLPLLNLRKGVRKCLNRILPGLVIRFYWRYL